MFLHFHSCYSKNLILLYFISKNIFNAENLTHSRLGGQIMTNKWLVLYKKKNNLQKIPHTGAQLSTTDTGTCADEQRIKGLPLPSPEMSSSESAVAQRLQANELAVCSPRPLQTSPIEFKLAGGGDIFIIVV